MKGFTWAMVVVAAVELLAMVTAASAIWLALTKLMVAADVFAAHHPGPLVRMLANGLGEIWRALVSYL